MVAKATAMPHRALREQREKRRDEKSSTSVSILSHIYVNVLPHWFVRKKRIHSPFRKLCYNRLLPPGSRFTVGTCTCSVRKWEVISVMSIPLKSKGFICIGAVTFQLFTCWAVQMCYAERVCLLARWEGNIANYSGSSSRLWFSQFISNYQFHVSQGKQRKMWFGAIVWGTIETLFRWSLQL